MGISLSAIGDAIASAVAATSAASAGAAGAIGSGLTGLGVGSETAGLIGSSLVGGLEQAGIGSAVGALAGNPAAGAEIGGLSGLGAPLGAAAGADLGIGATLGSTLGGAAGGTIGGAIGGNPLAGALSGGISGLTQGISAGATPSTGTATPVGPSSAAAAAPSASGGVIPTGGPGTDLTGAFPGASSPVTSSPLGSIGGVGGGTPETISVTGTIPAPTGGASGIGSAAPGIIGGATAGALPGNDNALNYVGVTPNQATGQLGGTSTPDNLGAKLAQQLGLGQGGQQFFGKYGGDLLQGGLLGLSGFQQQGQLNSLLGPIKSQAQQLSGQSLALEAPLLGGTLPAGAQAAIDNYTKGAEAQVRSTYANLGLSGSTMEADAINQVKQNAQAQTFNIANELFTQGQKGTAMSSDLYNTILQTQLGEDKSLSDAVGNFAAQLMGAQIPSQGKTISLNLGG